MANRDCRKPMRTKEAMRETGAMVVGHFVLAFVGPPIFFCEALVLYKRIVNFASERKPRLRSSVE